jgi:hydrogenase expression/formation protein HypD
MRYIDEYRDTKLLKGLADKIRGYKSVNASIMEFCGGHTVAILKYGIRQVLPEGVRMLSGPGCPVCVTDNSELDRAMEYAKMDGVILVSYGDMLRVPGSKASLSDLRAEGADIRFVYSPLDALTIAEQNVMKKVIFFAVGFETSTPAVAATILKAKTKGLRNFFVYSALKYTLPAAKAILKMGEVRLDGILGPGHVSTIIGYSAWEVLSSEYKIPIVISGFEPLDILISIDMLLNQISNGCAMVENEYRRSVTDKGNREALRLMAEVFEAADVNWRGLGILPESGFKIRKGYADYDAEVCFPVEIGQPSRNEGCRCDEVLRGLIEPIECPLFKGVCTPETPIGPCMVSSEGACAAYFHFGVMGE